MSGKHVAQLDLKGLFVGMTIADESPMEPGVYHMPAGTVNAEEPTIPAGHVAKWNGSGFDFMPMENPGA